MTHPVTGGAPADSDAMIVISGLNKWFGAFHVLRDIDLVVGRKDRIVICGPSGSGKSTLIRCINRLEDHQQGTIVVDGTELTHDLKNIDAIRREVGMVFQQFNLFPHLTVLENCTLGPIWVRKTPKREAVELAQRYLERVKIPEQADKYPGQLSRRATAARRHCPQPVHGTQRHAVRRADLGPRSGDDQGGAGRHGRPCRIWDDHAGGLA